MLLLRREDLDELLERATERGAEHCPAHLELENGSVAMPPNGVADHYQGRDHRHPGRAAGRGCHQVEVDGRRALTAKPKICLLDDWRRVLPRAWSIRFSLLAAALTAAEVVVPLFGDVLPRGAFVLPAFAASIGATVARIVAQSEMHR